MKKNILSLFFCLWIGFPTVALANSTNIIISLGFSGPIESLTPSMASSAEMAIQEARDSKIFLGGRNIFSERVDSTCIDTQQAVENLKASSLGRFASGIIGADCSGVSTAILENFALTNNIAMISPSATSPHLTNIYDNNLFFRTSPSDKTQAKILAETMINKGIKSAAVTYTNNDYGRLLAENFKYNFKLMGGMVTIILAHEDGKNEYSQEVEKLSNAGGEALVVAGYLDQGGGYIFRTSLKMNAFKKYVLPDGMIGDSLISSLDTELPNSFGILPAFEPIGHKMFKSATTQKGIKTGPFSGNTYDAAALMLLAMQAAGSDKSNKYKNFIVDVANAPGIKIYPGEIKKGLKLLIDGFDIDYVGVTGVELDTLGDALGFYEELGIKNNQFVRTKIIQSKSNQIASNNSLSPSYPSKLIDAQTPSITIASTSSNDRRGTISGTVKDNIGVAELRVDGKVVPLKPDGSFEWQGFVPAGGKSVVIEAIDTSGLSSMQQVRLERGQQNQVAEPSFAELNPFRGKAAKKNRNALALIVGVSDYKRTSDPAIYADKDAQYFHDYAAVKLGVPDNNIFSLVNDKADKVEITKAVKNWLLRMSVKDKTDVYVFFAGHGLASSDGSNMFLLPYDGDPELLEDSAIDRRQLFADIQAISPRSVTVFLDSCYSGGTRAGGTLVASLRPITIRTKEQNIPDGFTVLSAAKGDQTSQSLEEAKHGLFSYFLMRGLEGDADANNDNQITAGELHSFVTDKVERQSGFKQTPDLQGDAERVLVRFE